VGDYAQVRGSSCVMGEARVGDCASVEQMAVVTGRTTISGTPEYPARHESKTKPACLVRPRFVDMPPSGAVLACAKKPSLRGKSSWAELRLYEATPCSMDWKRSLVREGSTELSIDGGFNPKRIFTQDDRM
jgi:hypothetical protein